MRLEAYTCHKDPRAPLANDDRIVAYSGRLFAVIDGVTTKKGSLLPGGKTRGQAAGVLIERALRELVDEGDAMAAGTGEILERIRSHFVAEYARLDMVEDSEDPHLRFGAQLACAFSDGSAWRLLGVGDCGIRLNGDVVSSSSNRGDGVVALLRAQVFAAAREHLGRADHEAGRDDATIDRALAAARAYTVAGSGAFIEAHANELPLEAYEASSAAAERQALAAYPDLPPTLVRETLRHGLLGIGAHRNTSGPLGAPCIDGTVVPVEQVNDRTIDADAVASIELFSDGYFGTPPQGQVSVAAWEAHIAHVEATDPYKIGAFPSTKGSSSGRFTDDRTVLIVAPGPRRQE